MISAIQKNITFSGLIPAKESENILPIVPAGFANDVEDVNQYAEPIYDATTIAIFSFFEINIKKLVQKMLLLQQQKYLQQWLKLFPVLIKY